MSYADVLERGDEFLSDYPRTTFWWNYASHATCLGMILASKGLLNLLYNPHVHHVEHLDKALARARAEDRSLLTVMNHMSVVDDPAVFSMLPMRFHSDIDTIRWGFGAHNICFSNKGLSWFFNLGKILGTKRFGEGPFQASLDAAIRIMSPDDTLDLEFSATPEKNMQIDTPPPGSFSPLARSVTPLVESTRPLMQRSPFIRTKTSWFHVFPEGFVLQLEQPDNNSMRYFKWGVARLILESTRAPIVVPMFSCGFEKIAPEESATQGIKRWLPQHLGADIHLFIGEPVADEKILEYRKSWEKMCDEKGTPGALDLNEELKNGKEAQSLRAAIAADLRAHVLRLRESLGFFPAEKAKFADPMFWKKYTLSEGASDESVKFIGQNWAIRRLQKHLPEYNERP